MTISFPFVINGVPRFFVAVFFALLPISLGFADTQTGVTGQGVSFENRQPTLTIRYIIALQGIFPNEAQGTPSGDQAPDRTTPFIGEIRAISFDFPPRGWAFCEGQLLSIAQNQALFSLIGTAYGGNGQTTFALPDLRERVPIGAGQAPGLPDYPLGTKVGDNTATLTESNLPSHTHTVGNGNTAPAGNGSPFDNRQPSLAFHFLIAADGQVLIAPWPQEPVGWAHCDGRLLPRNGYTLLFNSIANLYGGDGVVNFALPDTRGRIVLGDDTTTQVNSWPPAKTVGSNDAVLALADMPAHTHTLTTGLTGSTGAAGNTASNYQPSIVMHWLLASDGIFPSRTAANSINTTTGTNLPIVGEILLHAGNAAAGLGSLGWLKLYGTIYPISDYDTLFNVIGTTYGGDGQQTFAVPDLRSLATMAVGTSMPIASFAGLQAFLLSVPNLAAHSHALVPEISIELLSGPVLSDGSSVDFGQLNADDSGVQKTFTIRNLGAMDLTLGSITKDGTDPSVFTVSTPGAAALAPGGSTTFTITFDPPTAGSRSASIHLANNDADENPFDIAVTGRRLTHLETWRLQYFNSTKNGGAGADTNDFDKDGLTNVEEFAIGGDPKQFTALPQTVTRAGNTVQFTYQRSKAAIADGFTFAAEFRPDLVGGSWSNVGVTEEILSETAQLQQVRASLTIPADQSREFSHLTISLP
jgi:microcystin-dependent protein